jgi:hypothetical protein
VIRYAPLIFFAVIACGRGPAERRFALDAEPRRSLVGAWDANLSLTRPYPLGHGDPAGTRICGTIGFVENHYASRAELPTGVRPHLGVYDLDLPALGLDWLGDNTFPAAVVSEVRPDRAAPTTPSDTVAIVLNPGSPERIVLLGQYDIQGIAGKWTAQSSRGTATGAFSLRRHETARGSSC